MKLSLNIFCRRLMRGIRQQMAEIDVIIKRSETPDFDNTIMAYDNSGELLSKVSKVFSNLNGANTNPQIQMLAREISPKLTQHGV